MEGRDIGTVVFPGADVKIYLDATPEERARRRATIPAHSLSAGADQRGRRRHGARSPDRSDRTRSTSPLIRAADAVVIDTTGVPIEDVIERVLALVGNQGSGAYKGASVKVGALSLATHEGSPLRLVISRVSPSPSLISCSG